MDTAKPRWVDRFKFTALQRQKSEMAGLSHVYLFIYFIPMYKMSTAHTSIEWRY